MRISMLLWIVRPVSFHVYAKKEVVEEVERPATQISLEKAKMMNSKYDLGDIINIRSQQRISEESQHREQEM